jgi:hypothetical protein
MTAADAVNALRTPLSDAQATDLKACLDELNESIPLVCVCGMLNYNYK